MKFYILQDDINQTYTFSIQNAYQLRTSVPYLGAIQEKISRNASQGKTDPHTAMQCINKSSLTFEPFNRC